MFVFVMLSRLFLAAMRSPAGKELTFWRACIFCFLVCVFFSLSYTGVFLDPHQN